jgi:hypothetical protein
MQLILLMLVPPSIGTGDAKSLSHAPRDHRGTILLTHEQHIADQTSDFAST